MMTTCLCEAARQGRVQELKELLNSPLININSVSPEFGRTALHWACSRGDIGIVIILLSAGADINCRDTSYRETPLVLAILGGHLELVELLCKNGADMNANIDGDTPLLIAMQLSQYNIAKLLVIAGAEVKDCLLRIDEWLKVTYSSEYAEDDNAENELHNTNTDGEFLNGKWYNERDGCIVQVKLSETDDTLNKLSPLLYLLLLAANPVITTRILPVYSGILNSFNHTQSEVAIAYLQAAKQTCQTLTHLCRYTVRLAIRKTRQTEWLPDICSNLHIPESFKRLLLLGDIPVFKQYV